ncbi:GNAT family N-acetyltransferase [Bacillus sp. 123MFChir2]|uniref:GNAT family N-acetyltransferase n=1 Tax=Bacillus sp. 123MFChir2 TaxID=1169144 RepID=UPI0003643AEC|nr:GNAT family N-acetyltransferase [Bacillus sp. 123MFChir2]
MDVNLEIEKVKLEDKTVLKNLTELYKYDFSEFDPEDVNEHGLYEYMYVDHYFTEEGRFPFFIKVNGKYAGFALIREVEENGRTYYSMSEFFVMKKYRKSGVGRHAALQLFSKFHGEWEVAEMEENVPAQAFWRKVISLYTNNEYREIRKADWDGPIQVFDSRGSM